MDSRLLHHYNQELLFIREMGTEFARRYPKVAGRLDLGGTECADPYVERLLEGYAFLTARVQHKLEAEFPRFTQHLLEMVYPHYLTPTPSMIIVQFEADLEGGITETGFLLPRQTELRGSSSHKGRARCEFRTAHAVMLWPLRLNEARYLPQGEAGRYSRHSVNSVKSAIQLRLETVSEIPFRQLTNLDTLPLYLHGSGSIPMQLHESILAHGTSVVIRGSDEAGSWEDVLDKQCIQALGFDEQQALLPYTQVSFQGYRLLQEYFVLPQRFMFIELSGLQRALQRSDATTLEIVILLDVAVDNLEGVINTDNFALNCTPAINLFPKRADRIHLSHRSTEHQLIIDKTRQRDYEVYSITCLEGYGSGTHIEQVFRPFYAMQDDIAVDTARAYYTIRRQPSLESSTRHDRDISALPYLGSEIFISLVDGNEAPFSSELKQLGATVLCTNRDLAQLILPGQHKTDFTLKIGAPVNAIKCLVGPTDPKPAVPEGEHSWRLISHLSLNYLTLLNNDETQGAVALRELLKLYADFSEASISKQVDGLLTVHSQPVVRRLPVNGPMSFGRGMEISINFNEQAFEGSGAFLLGSVLDRFFAKYVSLNSFTQTVVKTRERGEIMRWPVRTGTRTLI